MGEACLPLGGAIQNHISSSVVLASIVLAGCASIVSKSEYPVAVTSNPTGAEFVVKRSSGLPIASGVTPATITLSSSEGYFKPAKYTIEFKRKGVVQSVPLTAKINGWYFGNLVFGGITLSACSSSIRPPASCGRLRTRSSQRSSKRPMREHRCSGTCRLLTSTRCR